ncbi:two-component sensor histidine kinase [Colwellia sp. MB02u-18]|uniref:ATP-binding protein n=1 Tax=unclassified Colwellia TaxID=196834 RepID=UPI0015F739B4|nr:MULTISPECIES: ATP-binding protein [unclassified Colwellia]MBA6225322.1 two-component sensor histidine kinase [Colwellia sp. MB3u-45]MBA6267228.1 two-component sensor histidine kinase [Colwellia sp. MB3u-43]MBA6322840.1 two-component sensor histidine kinase [Colwellia sp. MB02u-19]MBA6324752.1 two-component sensor histidine kinase [Colwellia sp. MB02u-18]MBA6331057.1 two-component sensor histidine kinase [Colwellia sp. MB02u-12]
MKLGRSFFSLYFLIISIFIVFSWMLDEAWSSYLEQDIESYTGYKSMLLALSNYLEKHPEDQWQEILSKAAKQWQLPLKLMSAQEVKAISHQNHDVIQEENTHIYYDNNAVEIHHQINNAGTVIVLGPAKMPTRPRLEALIRVILLATLACILFFWLRPLSRDLDQLQKTAIEFGQESFDVVAPEARSTMAAPMVTAFNTMASRIKRLIDAHKELSTAVAHELRTPLARTKFALEMLACTDDKAKQEKYRKAISKDVCELEQLISEMLIYASFDNDKPEINFSEESLVDIVEKQVSNYQQFEQKFNIVNLLGNERVEVDRHFISRALNNYISNAIKYGNGEIDITITKSEDYCQISVSDNGEGVCDDFKCTIFDAFSRGDVSRNRQTGGFGLGLAIVCRIMEWHGGSASVVDSNNGGASFILRWPIKQISA